MAEHEDHEGMVRDFCNMSGSSPEQATQYLEANDWDMMAACNSYFQDEDERSNERESGGQAAAAAPPAVDENYTGPRTLDGRPAPQSSSRATGSAAKQPKRKGIATLGSLGGGSHQHDDDCPTDDDDFDDDDDDGRGNLFAGGEKSGLAVQDPNQDQGPKKIIGDILAKAKANAARPDPNAADAGPSRQTQFRGAGVTLGGEGVESRSIPDPHGSARPSSLPAQERVLHVWQDGFSIDDGDLRRFDDPANQADLQMIRSGRAPLHLMNVEPDQPVDVKLHQHDTPYAPQPKKYKPFSGSGQRLGSPVPGASGTATPTIAAISQPAAASSSSAPAPEVDSSQPTIMIRIQLPDGTRLPARFNTTHTLGDVYGFVQGASAETRGRSWVLATTFPNKEHTDKDLVLSDVPEFKKGGTAVVKWT